MTTIRANGFALQVVTKGQLVRSFTIGPFTEEDGTPVDPATVAVVVAGPGAYTRTYTYGTDPELSQIGTGLFQLEFAPDRLGYWKGRWTATDPNVADETFELWCSSRFAA